MATLVRALVNPELLVWARESARLTAEDAAKKAQVTAKQVRAWESGHGQPTIGQLRKLGRVYKRPLAVFYLPKPPKHFQALRDFRRLSRERTSKESPELAFEIRRARYRREIALDLYQELRGEEPKPFAVTATIDADPEAVAVELRKYLGVEKSEAASWKTSYDAFNRWRAALEDAGVLVLQASEVEVSEARGFSISEQLLPVIVVNIKDAPSARIFSMIHEAVHLMLHEGGVCDVLDELSTEQERIEVFCNRVAGATLVPKDWLLGEDIVRRQQGPRWPNEAIELLSQRYRVSREVALRRLLVLGRTTEGFYKKKRKELQEEFEAQQEEALQRKLQGLETGFTPPYRMAVSTAGPFFVRLVLNSYRQEKITSNDLSSFLEIRLKHIPKIEQAVFRRPTSSGARA